MTIFPRAPIIVGFFNPYFRQFSISPPERRVLQNLKDMRKVTSCTNFLDLAQILLKMIKQYRVCIVLRRQ